MTSKLPLIILSTAPLASGIFAQTTWTGASDSNWDNASNWTDGSPGFNETATFSGAPTVNQPDIEGVDQTGNAIDFQSAGWTISDSVGGGRIRVDGGLSINSAGAGVNTISTGISGSGGVPVTMGIGSGNTLVYNGTDWNNGGDKIFSGSGTFVYAGNTYSGGQSWTFTGATTILSNTNWSVGSSTVNNGATIGGTGALTVFNYQTLTIGNNGTLAPGGNGAFGSEISTFNFNSSSATKRAEIVLDTGSTALMQIGSGGAGDNDKVTLDLNSSGNLTINSDATLNIVGSSIADGTYTLFENIGESDNITGTFDTVLFNGSPINPENFTINYGTDSITVDITGIIPEPRVYALVVGAICGLVIFRRRR